MDKEFCNSDILYSDFACKNTLNCSWFMYRPFAQNPQPDLIIWAFLNWWVGITIFFTMSTHVQSFSAMGPFINDFTQFKLNPTSPLFYKTVCFTHTFMPSITKVSVPPPILAWRHLWMLPTSTSTQHKFDFFACFH